MANFQQYSLIYATIDGALLTQEASLTINMKSGLNPVFTVAGGFSGMTKGADSIEATIESAIPSTDFEYNPSQALRTGTPIEVGFIAAGRQLVAKGFVTEADFSHSVNNESKLSLKCMLKMADWE